MSPSKEDLERGYTPIPQPPLDDSNNMGQLKGKKIPVGRDMPKESD